MTISLIAMIKEYFGYFADRLRNKKATFVLVIATTDVSLIPGITIAGEMYSDFLTINLFGSLSSRSGDPLPVTMSTKSSTRRTR